MLTTNPHKLTLIKEGEFETEAINVFHFQYRQNPLYKAFVDVVEKNAGGITKIGNIPFLPVSFFKTHAVKTTPFAPVLTFESSGTTGTTPSRHFVKDVSLCQRSLSAAFQQFYNGAASYCILALLPSYLEQGHSSLVYMVQALMNESKHPLNGFYLNNLAQLHQTLTELEKCGQKTLLIGVTYALINFAAQYPMPLKHTTVMETGGMKGRKKELLRTEVHGLLKDAFYVNAVHSEYGMTELLSQGYALKDGRFNTPPWMKVLIRDEDDPKAIVQKTSRDKIGSLNVIDLANLWSCSFIATEDVGRLHPDGSFEVLGRMDHTDIRGCSLLAL